MLGESSTSKGWLSGWGLSRLGAMGLALALAFSPAVAATPELQAQLVAAEAEDSPIDLEDFSRWLGTFKTEALRQGISRATLTAAFAGVKPLPRVLELDKAQPEHKVSLESYLEKAVRAERVVAGQRQYQRHRKALETVAARTGVPAPVILALWGMESDFGAYTGKFAIIPALATLAYDGRRAAFFRGELMEALRIVEEEGIPPSHLRGSWAGAMGQNQFMPSTYRRYAVSYSGQGRGDIWNTPADVFAASAHYLQALGWRKGESWGMEVTLPSGRDFSALAGGDKVYALSAWAKAGLSRVDGQPLPSGDIEAALILPDGASGRAFLIFANFKVIMKWNHSTYFATAVGQLANAMTGEP